MSSEIRRTVFVWNAKASGAGTAAELKATIAARADALVLETAPGEETRAALRRAFALGPCKVVAAGGDGTVSAVANTLLGCGFDGTFAVLPLGTGNDLARSLGMPLDPREALAVVDAAQDVRPLDVMRIASAKGETYAVNVANGGAATRVTENVASKDKRRWRALAYVRHALKGVRQRRPFHLRFSIDDGPELAMRALNVVVANARTAGGGIRVAPQADPSDGLLEVLVVRDARIFDLARLAAKLAAGDLSGDDLVFYRRARRVRIQASPAFRWSTDGELFHRTPTTLSIVPGALRAVFGPG